MKHILTILMLITIQYTVAAGDTLQSIAEQYCPGTDAVQVAEFREGIRELNYELVGEGEVWPGMEIQINKWEG